MSLTAREVYDTIGRMNREGSLSTPLNALGVTAQTWHETGGYRHTCGKDNTNLAGIKCSSNWLNGSIPWSTRKCVSLKTQEFTGGAFKDFKLAFRWYDSLETYLKDHARLIALYYPVSRDNADCVWGYIAGLQGKWATSPNYFRSVSGAVLKMAPGLIGADWWERLKASYLEAVRRNVLTADMKAYLHSRVM